MTAIEPGETIWIEYGKGHKIEATALDFRQEAELARIEDAATNAETAEQVWQLFESALPVAFPAKSEAELSDLLGKLNLNMVQEVIGKLAPNQFLRPCGAGLLVRRFAGCRDGVPKLVRTDFTKAQMR